MSEYSTPSTGADRDPNATLVRRFGKADISDAVLVSDASNVIHTPAAGRSVRMKWVYVSAPASSSDTVVTVWLGAKRAYMFPLPPRGVFMRTSIREGVADAQLKVTLSVATDVYVNYELEEF